jgi:hypothetical protein
MCCTECGWLLGLDCLQTKPAARKKSSILGRTPQISFNFHLPSPRLLSSSLTLHLLLLCFLSAAKMDKRTAESPMDFEWQSRGGPGDVTSPFYQLSMQHDNKKRASRPYRVGSFCFQFPSN